MSKLQLMRAGYITVMPLMVGVMPFGVVFGALASAAGMSVWEALGMSIFVIAGSSQFVAVGLIADSAPIAIIVFTTFIINLRHFLYSASLASFLRPVSGIWKAVLGYFMIDEVYAAVIKRQQLGEFTPDEFKWYFLGGGLNLGSLWWLTTVVGVWLGNVIPEDMTTVLAFTLPLIFTAIVVPLVTSSPQLMSALSAALTAILFAPLPNNLNLIVAAFVGIAVGLMMETHQLRRSRVVLP
ncbi:MAG: AzlC family ABC transporter permease [Chloroflexi bacterium]|nr:AzlC family ABC transporter permease [Chloroflexota bacterium]